VDRTVADPVIGRVLDGRYLVGPRVARGGMATVYEATDLRLDRICALKIMHAGLGDDEEFAARFVREARSAARLSHPNVVSVFDQGDDAGTLFLAMEYVPGHTLRDLIRHEAPVSPARALALLDPVLSALAAAHHAGMIHRDVKPENVLLADDGRVKVADFGLARAVSADTQHATTGVLIGTVSYLAPELVEHGRADARTDVYAAGVVLYEMLTGRKPHQGQSPIEVAMKHVREDVPPPSRVVPTLPPYVDALVARATARDPDRRPADARVLLHQVRRVRAALDEGMADDPDLTDDLTPTMPVQRDSGAGAWEHDPAPDDLATVLTPAQAATGGRTDDTGTVGPRLAAVRSPGTAPAGARPARPRPRRSRRGPVLLLVVLLLAVAAAGGAWWLGSGRYTKTPGVLNLSSASAERRVESQGLHYSVAGRSWSETVPAGSVVRTTPSGGERVARDGTVRAFLSRGPERHAVPAVAGKSLDDAQASLQGARLSLRHAVYRWSDEVAKGLVLRPDPTTGTSLRRGAAVDLLVSKGPKPIKVRDYTGKDAAHATKALQKLHFQVTTTQENSDTVDKGDVVSQSPDSGTLTRGDEVKLVVSKGPVLVSVPDVRRMSVGEATSTLEDAGFQVRSQRTDVYIGLGLVVKQSPGDGDRVPRGSTVTVYVV
jgi:beta-lactam-binding protein with PASTA domain/serine/threonine protein kinase